MSVRAIVCLLLLGFPFFALGQSKTRVRDSLEALLTSLPPDTHRVTILNQISNYYLRSDVEKSKQLASEAIDLALELDFQDGLAEAYLRIGSALHQQNANEPALEYFLAAHEIHQQEGDSFKIAHDYNFQANIYSDYNSFEIAEEHYKNAERIFLSIGAWEEAMIPRHNLGSLYGAMDEQEKALEQYFLNYRQLDKVKNWKIVAATNNNIGNTYRELKRCSEGMPYLRKAEQVKMEKSDLYGLGNTWNNIGACFLQGGQIDSAEHYVNKALESAKSQGAASILAESFKHLADIEKAKGNFEKATYWLESASNYSDSLLNDEQGARVTGLKAAFDLKHAQKQVDLLKDEKVSRKRLNILLGSGLSALAIVVLILFLSVRQRVRANKMLSEKNAQIESQKEEIEIRHAELQAQNERLEDIMREKDGLIGVVAHDLKAPLARSSGLANLISLSGPLNSEQEMYLKMIEKVTQDGSQLIRDLLDLNAIEHPEAGGNPNRFQFDEVVADTVRVMAVDADKKSIHLEIQCESGKDVVMDKSFLSRVIENLLSNAIKFSPSGKNVWIKTYATGQHVHLSIRDEGPGLTAEDKKKLYKKFQKLSARPTSGESSTGLGLAITKALVERLGGTIHVKSEPKMGAEFICSLPPEPVS